MTNERWLRWAIGRYYRSKGYKVSMRPARVGNAMVDGIAIGPEGERVAIEVKSPSDDIIRGIGQCVEAIAAGYNRAVLVTTLRVARKLRKRVFQMRRLKLMAVDAKARIHRYDPDGWRLLDRHPTLCLSHLPPNSLSRAAFLQPERTSSSTSPWLGLRGLPAAQGDIGDLQEVAEGMIGNVESKRRERRLRRIQEGSSLGM